MKLIAYRNEKNEIYIPCLQCIKLENSFKRCGRCIIFNEFSDYFAIAAAAPKIVLKNVILLGKEECEL